MSRTSKLAVEVLVELGEAADTSSQYKLRGHAQAIDGCAAT